MLKCRVANTGRTEAGFKKNAAQTVVELDTLNLPTILWGHEKEVSTSARNNIPLLKPGEISPSIWLNVTATEPSVAPSATSITCPDLVIDTASILRYVENEMSLQYIIQNIGSAPVEITGKSLQLGVNIYFISGTKLTRGAIPAGNTMVEIGRETLTGWLIPGQKLRGETIISLKNRTKFAPNILMELSPPQSLIECDRTNNTRWIEVKY